MYPHSVPRKGILLTADIRHSGERPREVQRLVAAGALHRIRRGALIDATAWSAATPHEQYVMRIRAVVATRQHEPTLCLASAAAMHKLPLLYRQMAAVHLSSEAPKRSGNGVVYHQAIPGRTPVLIDGIWCTSLVDTLADLAFTSDLAGAVIPLDNALHTVATHALPHWQQFLGESAEAAAAAQDFIAQLQDAVLGTYRTRGLKQALRSLAFASHLSDSPGESLSRCEMHLLGFPPPMLQYPLYDADGLIGIVDFWWPSERVAGEFDGEDKYRNPVFLHGRTAEQAVIDEKWREDRIRAVATGFTRWGWSDMFGSRQLYGKLTRAGLRALDWSPSPAR